MVLERRQARWLRFARLVVACLAVFLARPASGSSGETLDRIVLVARAVAEAHDERAPARRVRIASQGEALDVACAPAAATAVLDEVQSTRVYVERKYIRHCALLD